MSIRGVGASRTGAWQAGKLRSPVGATCPVHHTHTHTPRLQCHVLGAAQRADRAGGALRGGAAQLLDRRLRRALLPGLRQGAQAGGRPSASSSSLCVDGKQLPSRTLNPATLHLPLQTHRAGTSIQAFSHMHTPHRPPPQDTVNTWLADACQAGARIITGKHFSSRAATGWGCAGRA